METRCLAALRLASKHLGNRIVCHRPSRRGPPMMRVDPVNGNGQIIAHNYGHGGSGWTLAPGAVEYVNNLLLKELMADNVNVGDEGGIGQAGEIEEEKKRSATDRTKTTPICVVGAGVIGLFTAYNLVKRGFTNLTVIAESFEQLASHNAGGLLAPTFLDVKDSDAETINQICIDAYRYYAKIARNENADFPNGARFMPAYFDEGKGTGFDPYVKEGIMEKKKEVLVQAGTAPVRKMGVFDDAIFIETTKMLYQLREFLEHNGVTFTQWRLQSLDELDAKIVVNCAGIGAKELCGDEAMYSVQGHLILLKDQEPEDLNYMLVHWADKAKTENGQEVTRALYIFPKSSGNERDVGVIGGTFVNGADASTPNNAEFDLILERANQFFGME